MTRVDGYTEDPKTRDFLGHVENEEVTARIDGARKLCAAVLEGHVSPLVAIQGAIRLLERAAEHVGHEAA